MNKVNNETILVPMTTSEAWALLTILSIGNQKALDDQKDDNPRTKANPSAVNESTWVANRIVRLLDDASEKNQT